MPPSPGLPFDRDEIEGSLPTRLERIAAYQPHHIAISANGLQLTYAQLNRRVNQLAHAILKRTQPGVGCIAYLAGHSPDMVICALAALKAVKAYLCVHPGLPAMAQREIIADASPELLLTVKLFEARADQIAAEGCDILVIEEIDDLHSAENPRAFVTSCAPAAIVYTSGSTGRPKGVVKSHRTVLHRAWLSAHYDAISPADRQSLLTYCSFASSEVDVFGALLNGATLSLWDLGSQGLEDFGVWIREQQITVLHPPVLWFRRFLATLHGENLFPSVRLVALAGETVIASDIERWRLHFARSCALRHRFSSTEAGHLAVACIEPDTVISPGVMPACRPVVDKHLSLHDEQGQAVQPGETGELIVSSAYLSDGYWRRPLETADSFWTDSDFPHRRVFRTGDLGRFLSNGSFEFQGRRDNQVKIRGYRVELGEIETALCEAEGVREAVAVSRENGAGEKSLLAYVVADGTRAQNEFDLKTTLRARLPEYMIPTRIEFLPALPLTPTGKVDRRALPEPTMKVVAGVEALPPRNLLELELIRLWRRLFQREDIGRQDNFFELGGHSLLATRLATEIDKLLGRKLPIAALFQSPTVESLTRRLTRENWAPPWSSLVPLQPAGSQPPLFCVHHRRGDIYGFLELAKLLPSDQPSYGIQAVGLDGNSARHVTVEDMAAHYVKEILSFQRDGPFYLAGYSMGGLIAFEMARQLHRLGQRVALLALLDSAPSGEIPWVLYGLSMSFYIPGRCLFHFRHWWELPRRERLNYFRGRWAGLRYWMVQNRSKPPPVTAPPPEDSEPPQVPGFYGYYHAIASAYRVHPYPGSADVFVSDQTKRTDWSKRWPDDQINPRWRWWYWRYLARGGVSFHRVPGMHCQLLESGNLPALAKALGTVLHRAQEKERATPFP